MHSSRCLASEGPDVVSSENRERSLSRIKNFVLPGPLLVLSALILLQGCASPQAPLSSENVQIREGYSYLWLEVKARDPRWERWSVGVLVIKVDGNEVGTMRWGQSGVLSLKKGERRAEFYWNESYPLWPKTTIRPNAIHTLGRGADLHTSLELLISDSCRSYAYYPVISCQLYQEPVKMHVRPGGKLSEKVLLSTHYFE